MWIRCLGGERLPTASYAVCPNMNKLFCSPREEGSRFFVVCFLHPSRRYTFDIDVESTHGQPASSRARPVYIDDAQNSKWIRGSRGREVARDALRSLPKNLKKCLIFAIGEGSRLLVVFFCTPASKCFFLGRLAGARHISPSFV